MEVWLECRPVRLSEVKAIADLATDAGVAGIALNEIKCPPEVAAAVAFEHAPTVPVVSSVIIAFPRSPTVTAYNAWQLHHQSSGRFQLGLGTQVKGHMERRFGVRWRSPRKRLREYVECVRAIWNTWENDEPLDFAGDHYRVNLMSDDFNPGPNGLPFPLVHTAAVNEGMCELAGEISDGLIMAEPLTKEYQETVMMPAIGRGIAKAGRSRADLIITGGGYIGLGESGDLEEIREHVRYRIAFYSSTRTYRRPLELHGWGDISEPLHALSIAGRWGEMSKYINDEMLNTFALIGTYEEAAEKIVERYGGIADRVYIGPFLSKSLTVKNLRQVVKALRKM